MSTFPIHARSTAVLEAYDRGATTIQAMCGLPLGSPAGSITLTASVYFGLYIHNGWPVVKVGLSASITALV